MKELLIKETRELYQKFQSPATHPIHKIDISKQIDMYEEFLHVVFNMEWDEIEEIMPIR